MRTHAQLIHSATHLVCFQLYNNVINRDGRTNRLGEIGDDALTDALAHIWHNDNEVCQKRGSAMKRATGSKRMQMGGASTRADRSAQGLHPVCTTSC